MATTRTEEVGSEEETTTDGSTEEEEETSTSQETTEEEGTGEETTDESASETPDDEASEEEDETTTSEDEESEGDFDLSDDDLDNLLTGYRERLLDRPGLKDSVSQQIKSQVDRQVQEATRGVEGTREVGDIIQKGQQAVQAIATLATSVTAELAKAKQGEVFDADVFDQNVVVDHLRGYGSAIVAEQAHRYDSAVEQAFDSLFGTDGLPSPTEEQAGTLRQAMEVAQRMEGDPNQSSQAKGFFFKAILSFVADRAREQGATREQARVKSQKSVKERIAKSANRKAARAEIESEKSPPRTGKSKAKTSSSEPTMELYRELKKEGKSREAQEVVDAMAGGRAIGAGAS